MPPTARPTSRSSRGSRRCASGPACTSARPGPTGLHHLVWEVVDNSVDEAMAGPGHPDRRHPAGRRRRAGSATTGPGIPVDPHPKYPKQSTAEIVLTTLHAGGKFGGEGYKVSGGLHGVGVSVVNALSARLILEVDRDGQHWEAEFEKGGKLKRKVTATGPAPKDRSTGEPRTGTTVTFWPDADRLRRDRVPRPDRHRAPADHGVLEQGPRDPLHRRADRPRDRRSPSSTTAASSTSSSTSTRRRSRCSARSARSSESEDEPGGRDRAAVEHRLPRVDPLASPTASPPSRAACTSRASPRPSPTW